MIFISHSTGDNAWAQGLMARLAAHRYPSFFLDFDPEHGIPPGVDWERVLYQRIRSCRAMIVVCSCASMKSHWCFMEITHARALGKPLFLLKVDDCALHSVLAHIQAIDFTQDEEGAYARLLNGLRIAGLDPAGIFPWDRARPPYPGLLALEEDDAAVFFGRGAEVARGLELLNRVHHLGDPRVVMVLGASGTGKSSLVRAGLVPRIRRDPGRWIVVGPFRPRSEPARELAAALDAGGWSRRAERVRTGTDQSAIADALLGVLQDVGRPGAKVLLVIDQFEELLGAEDSSRFLEQLRYVADHPDAPAVVLGTMRSDFLDRFQGSPPLVDLAYDPLSLSPLSVDEISQVITGPAEIADLELETQLVATLVKDAGTPNALPLLAFTLRELWELRRQDGVGGPLTLGHYVRLGGMENVVGRAAEKVLLAASVTPEQESALRASFLAMVQVTDDGRHARRVATWSTLPSEAHPLLERFVAARLLVSGTGGRERTVEVAHERIFESWDQLRGWIDDNEEALRLREEIERAARGWEGDTDGLWRGARLIRARELLVAGTPALSDLAKRFVEASERERVRRRRWVRGVSSGLAALLLIVTALAVYWAFQASSNAALAEERARAAEVERLRALSAQSFAESERVKSRALSPGITDHERRALEAISPKYVSQSERYEAMAARLQDSVQSGQRGAAIPGNPDALFTLEVLRAYSGSSMLVHYGPAARPSHIIIDGGPDATYEEALVPRLNELRAGRESLPVRLVISTQTDMPQMRGLINLMEGLQNELPASPLTIGAVWTNAFIPGPLDMVDDLAQVHPKARLVAGANALGIPVNAPFSRLITAPEAGAARVQYDHGLSITVLSPRVQWLHRFAESWLEDWSGRMQAQGGDPLAFPLDSLDLIETFADSGITLLPSPREIHDPVSERGDDYSPSNLASAVLMLEMNGRRILFTSDSRPEIILSALAQAGYSNREGMTEVDVLVVPQGGSNRHASRDFFERVRARYYVFSANGSNENPDVSTLEWLFDARRGDEQEFSIVLTYAPEEYRPTYPLRELCTLWARERGRGTRFAILTPAKERYSLGIDLGARATFVNSGVRNGVCGV